MRSSGRVTGVRSVPGIDLPGPDFTATACGHGCAAGRAEAPGGPEDALARALAAEGPALLDAAAPALCRAAGEGAR